MIQEIMLFGMGFFFALFIKKMKIVSITKEKKKDLAIAIAEAERMQERFNREGGSKELNQEQIESLKKLERHIAYREILDRFNYLIW